MIYIVCSNLLEVVVTWKVTPVDMIYRVTTEFIYFFWLISKTFAKDIGQITPVQKYGETKK